MIAINLKADTHEQKILKEYLEQNASEILAEKINRGVKLEKDGKTLISKKDFDTFLLYANEEAQKLAEKNARFACIKSDTVFGWMMHYFEENSIEGKLFNEDDTEYQPPKPVRKAVAASSYTPPALKPKPQMSLFDLMGEQEIKPQDFVGDDKEQESHEDIDGEQSRENLEKEEFTEEEMQEVMETIASETAQNTHEQPAASPTYQRFLDIQGKYPESVILLRLGDFYEVLGNSAVTVAKELDLTLTSRDFGLKERISMTGFPYHLADKYFEKLAAAYSLIVSEDESFIMHMSKETTEIIDLETGEIISRSKLEPAGQEDLKPAPEITKPVSEILQKLSDILGDTFIVR